MPRLHAYLATVGRDNGSHVYRVGGVTDHVHLLATLPRTVTQAVLLEEIKKHSSVWMKQASARYDGFTWQRGYGAFSVGYNQINALIRYIDNQEEHHRTRSFQDETGTCSRVSVSSSTNGMCGIDAWPSSWGVAPG